MALVWVIAGLVTLTIGAELLVRAAVRLARVMGLPPLIVGLTVVAYGTSAPEVAVSMEAAQMGQADIALGNVVGSNMFNVLFILGVSALIAPLATSRQLVRIDVPIMIGVSLLAWWMASDGSIGRVEGVCLTLGLVAYTAFLIRLGKKQPGGESADGVQKNVARPGWASLPTGVVMAIVGLGMLVVGARWLIGGATDLARMLGVGELLIGLTIVAAGTSLPELATSVVASFRGQRDIAIGNVVGSNIFNLLGVLGGTAVVAADGVAVSSAALRFDIPAMVAVAVACLPIFFTGTRISRGEGALFLAYYLVYVIFLVLAATKHEAMGPVGAIMLRMVIPATALGLLASVALHLRATPGRLPG